MSLLRFLLTSLILLSTTLWAGVGKVALLKGEATLERGVQKIALQNGSALEEKDIIKTSKDAQVQLMFEDKTVITLGSESEFKIEEYLNDTANPKAKFKFNQGAFKTITGQIGKTAPENFKLETKTATIGIRGTIVAGNVPPPPLPAMPPMPEAIFCLGGTITVAPIAMPNIVVVVPTGSFTQMLTPSTPPSPPVIFTPADLQQLNQNLGGTPPPPPPGGTPPQGGNTPPTANPDGGNDSPPPPPAPSQAPVPQTFTPTAAGSASQSNAQNVIQELVLEKAAEELGVDKDKLKEAIATDKPIEEIVKEIIPPVVDPVIPPVVDPVIPPVVDPVIPPVTPPSGGGGVATPTIVTKTLTVLGARESMNDSYMYLEPTTITLTGTSSTSLSGSLIAPLFSDVNASLITTQTIPIANVPENLLSMWGGEQLLIFGTPITSLPTDGIVGFQEIEDLGNAKMGTNFKNKRALIVDFDNEDNGLFLFFGTLGNGASLGGSIYSYDVGFSSHAEGNATGLFFGTSTIPYHVGLIGVDFNGSHYSAGAYAGFQTDYKATANISGDLTLTGLTTSRNSNRSNYKDDIELTIARSTGSTTGIITLHDDQGVTSGSYSLNQSDANKSSYIHDNYFAITGFDAQESWLVSFRTDVNFTTPDSALSWGIWAVNETNSSKLLPYYNYWVAGSTLTDNAVINTLSSNYTQYTYDGKALGVVSNNGSATPINSSDPNNAVRFVFNFGSQNPIDPNESYIRFGSWDLAPSNGVIANNFSGDLVGVNMDGFIGGEFYGLFYGTNAESIGGTFGASDETLGDARGVFVGAHTSTEQIPSTFYAGYATSSYLDGSTQYSFVDAVELNITDQGSASGILHLQPPSRGDIALVTETNTSFGPESSSVAWGRWSSDVLGEGNITLPSTQNVWVARNATTWNEGTTFISNFTSVAKPAITYRGNVIGGTYLNNVYVANIDEDINTNHVTLQFNFGETNPIDKDASYIAFTSAGKAWLLKLYDSSYENGYFNGTFDPAASTISGATPTGTTSLFGFLAGSYAEEIGGSFRVDASDTNTSASLIALGVFKAMQTDLYVYPLNFYPLLSSLSSAGTPITLSGLATSSYEISGTEYLSIDEVFSLTMNSDDSTTGVITLGSGRGTVSLDKSANSAEMTYESLNNFSIKDFNNSRSWMQTNNSEPNDYVSWGYWSVESNDTTKWKESNTYWVGGDETNSTLAASHILGLIGDINTSITSYSYTGKVLGRVIGSNNSNYEIDTASSSVNLYFDFGGGTGSLKNTSRINFSANSQGWELIPTATVTGGTFTGPIGGSGITGTIKGQFFGSSAQAVGGTFNAATATEKAIGVFKAVR